MYYAGYSLSSRHFLQNVLSYIDFVHGQVGDIQNRSTTLQTHSVVHTRDPNFEIKPGYLAKLHLPTYDGSTSPPDAVPYKRIIFETRGPRKIGPWVDKTIIPYTLHEFLNFDMKYVDMAMNTPPSNEVHPPNS